MEAVEDASHRWRANCRRTTSGSRTKSWRACCACSTRRGCATPPGDVFGRIYEYFLAEFSKQGAHDNGEFFTPPSIVQTIVNVIEPNHGIVLDPACGSGGMFVQIQPFHRGRRPGHDEARHLLRPREERDDRQARPDQPRRSWPAGNDPGRKRSHHLLQGPARTGRQVRLRHGQSAVQRGRSGCGQSQERQAPALRPARRQQGEEGLERQLSVAFLFLQLSERERPRWRR